MQKIHRHSALFLAVIALLAVGLLAVGREALAAKPCAKAQPQRHELQQKKVAAQGEIRTAQKQIRSNEGEIAANLRRMQVIEAEIGLRQKSIDSLAVLRNQLAATSQGLEQQIAQGNEELETLRSAYLREIKQMRLHRAQTNGLAFLLSAEDFHQGMARLRYMRRISQWRHERTEAISGQLQSLDDRHRQLTATHKAQSVALAQQEHQQEQMGADKARLQNVSAQLRSDNRGLQELISKKRKEIRALDSQTAALIAAAQRQAEQKRLAAERKQAEERRIAAEKKKAEEKRLAEERRKKQELAMQQRQAAPAPAREEKHKDKNEKPAPQSQTANVAKAPYAVARGRRPRSKTSIAPKPAPSQQTPQQTPQQTAKASAPKPAPSKTNHSSGFAAAKGRLPRPVSGLFRIVVPYGRHSRPDMPRVELDNTGIDAEVSAGAAVKSVYEGQVAAVYKAPGFGTVVLLRHGDYYTVYANLGSCRVSTGQKIKQGQQLGTVASSNGLAPTLHFEVWKQRTRLNPSEWLQ